MQKCYFSEVQHVPGPPQILSLAFSQDRRHTQVHTFLSKLKLKYVIEALIMVASELKWKNAKSWLVAGDYYIGGLKDTQLA